tara:strand:+ start:132 stop:1040 length:909 start_codon:yes stop_codon:yes gene_type:complete
LREKPTYSGILPPRPVLGYSAMLGNTVLIPIMAVAIKFLAEANFTTIQMLGWRSWIVLLVLFPFLTFKKFRQELLTADLKAHMVHATFSVCSMACFYFALRSLPIVTVTSINFTTPTIAMILTSLLYKDKVSEQGWLALFLGFSGAMIILRPDVTGIDFDALVVLVGSFLAACTNLAVRRMPARSSNFAVIFYLTFSGVIFFGLPSIAHFHHPTGDQWVWILLLGVTALGVHSLIILAYRFASSMLIGALDYLRIVWALGFGYFIFDETLNLSDVVGIIMICASGLLSVNSGRKAFIKPTTM